MTRHKIHILLFSCLMMMGASAFAQDPHFTQFHRVPTWYNPAAAGHGVEHIRLTLLYRNQWSSVTSPFKTEALFFDKQVSKVGFGANLVNNSSGDAGIRQLFMNGQLSYRHSFGKNRIAGGIQIGLIQKSFDPSKMSFDDQYTPDQGYNPANPTSETFSYTKLTRPDFGTGILWTHGNADKDRFLPYAGVSLQHINQPKESYIRDNNIIPRKVTAQAGLGIHLKELLVVSPMVTWAKQQESTELMGAIMVKLPMDGRDNVEGGLIYRNRDAVALYAGYQWNSFMMGISYDANISGLTGGPGAFELTLTYIPKAKVKKEAAKNKPLDKEKKPAAASAKKAVVKSPIPVTEPARNTTAPAGKADTVKKVNPADSKSAVSNDPVKKSSPASKTPAAAKTTVSPAPVAAPEMKKVLMKPLPSKVTGKALAAEPVRKTTLKKTGLPLPLLDTVSVHTEPRTAGATMTKALPKNLRPIAKPAEHNLQPLKKPLPASPGLPLVSQDPEALVISESAKQHVNVFTPDADSDGVADSIDHCPYMKGAAALQGCPDTDGDGISDLMDDCPMKAGSPAGGGCPENGEIATAGTGVTQHFGNIEFKTSSAEVHGIYKLDIIEPALDSLFEHDDLLLVITGHTDSEGDEAFNMNLSQARSDAVKAIFMRKGLHGERIITVAYGENMPLKDNQSDSGRQRNRRVEIHVIQKRRP